MFYYSLNFSLQKLQRSLEEKELASSQAYEERQWRCKEELEGLDQKCSSKLKQASQKSQRTQQVLHLQVLQLQQEKRQLRQELESLMKEQDLLETKLRSYEKEKTSFAPALEETQWEVRLYPVGLGQLFAASPLPASYGVPIIYWAFNKCTSPISLFRCLINFSY